MKARPPRWWRLLVAAYAPLARRGMLIDGAWSMPAPPPSPVDRAPMRPSSAARPPRPRAGRKAA